MTDMIIAKIQKNGREQLRVGLSEFKGHPLVSMWVWFRGSGGNMQPGRSGLSVRVSLLPRLIKALQEAEQEARKAGLLDERADA